MEENGIVEIPVVPEENDDVVLQTSNIEETTTEERSIEFPSESDPKLNAAIAESIREAIDKKDGELKEEFESFVKTGLSNTIKYASRIVSDMDFFIALNNRVILPTGTKLNRNNLNIYINENKDKIEEIFSTLKPGEKTAIIESDDMYRSLDVVYPAGINNEDDSYVNEVRYGNVDLGIKSTKKEEPDRQSKDAAVSRFLNILGLGSSFSVPLYHSGFRITFRTPTQAELSKLEFEIFNAEVKYGRETMGLITSNKRGFATDILTSFITDHIVSTTLELTHDDDIIDYISILDFNIIMLAFVCAITNNKLDITRLCMNSTNINNDHIQCGATYNGVADPSKFLFVNKNMLSKDMIRILSVTTSGKVTKEDRQAYINALEARIQDKSRYNGEHRKKFIEIPLGENNSVMEIHFKIPSLQEYIASSTAWLNNVGMEVDNIVSGNDSVNRDIVIREIIANNMISVISSNIGYIKAYSDVDKEQSTDEQAIIIETLSQLPPNKSIATTIQSGILNYITTSTIAVVGTPNFICPSCKKLQPNEEVNDDMKTILPYDVTDFFFKLIQIRNTAKDNDSLL